MRSTYYPKHICATKIDFEVEGGIIKDVKFTDGCDGNHSGISALVKGMPTEEAICKLSGIRCGFRPTSCPDQLAKALAEVME